MDIDRWEQVRENIKAKFKILEQGTEDLNVETADGTVKQGTAEFLVVETPMGKIKVAFEKRPVVLDKKFIYSHRAGQAARTEYTHSDSEFSYKLKAYKWNDLDEQWEEIDASNFS
jgi:hypothetical protein